MQKFLLLGAETFTSKGDAEGNNKTRYYKITAASPTSKTKGLAVAEYFVPEATFRKAENEVPCFAEADIQIDGSSGGKPRYTIGNIKPIGKLPMPS